LAKFTVIEDKNKNTKNKLKNGKTRLIIKIFLIDVLNVEFVECINY
jgi:hypothetical protein